MKKKRGLKTQLLVTSLVLTCFLSSFSFVRAAYAFSPHYFSYTHGSVSIGTYIEEANTVTATSFDIATVCAFNFDAYYSGTVTLKWSHDTSNYQQHLTEWSVVAVGAKIDSLTSGQVVFRVYDQKNFQVILHYYAANLATIPSDDPGFNFTSATSSLTAVTNHNSEYDNIKSIDTRLQTMNTNFVNLISAANNAQSYLGDISGYVDGVEGYLAKQYNGNYDSDVEQLLNSIMTDQQSGNNTLSSVNTRINNLQTYLSTVIGAWDVNDPPLNIIQALNSIAGDMSSLESDISTLNSYVNDIKNNVNSINSKLTQMAQDLSSLLSTVQNIDNLIDTISWNDYESDFYWSTEPTADRTLWSNSAINSNLYETLYIYFKVPTDPGNKLVRFTRRMYANSNNQSLVIEPYGIVGGNIGIGNFNIWTSYQRPFIEIYIYPPFNFSIASTNYICCKVTSTNNNTYIYLSSTDTAKGYINTTNIEYWQLISYFDQMKQYSIVNDFDQQLYSKLNEILAAINSINFNVNVTDQDVQDITTDFDTDIETIHNIENNYGLNFDGWDDQITSSDLAMDLTSYSDTVNLFKTNITALWQSPLVSLPILLSCLCFIFLVILG